MPKIISPPVWQKISRSSDPDLAQCVEVAAVTTAGPALYRASFPRWPSARTAGRARPIRGVRRT